MTCGYQSDQLEITNNNNSANYSVSNSSWSKAPPAQVTRVATTTQWLIEDTCSSGWYKKQLAQLAAGADHYCIGATGVFTPVEGIVGRRTPSLYIRCNGLDHHQCKLEQDTATILWGLILSKYIAESIATNCRTFWPYAIHSQKQCNYNHYQPDQGLMEASVYRHFMNRDDKQGF